MLDKIFIRYLRSFIATPRLNRSSTSSEYQMVDEIGRNLIYKYHSAADKAFMTHWTDSVGREQTILTVIFVCCFPAAVLGIMISYSKISSLRTEQQQLFLLFLMMPIKELENQRIKTFLTTGKTGKNKNEESNNVDVQIEATLTKTERILQAAADAVIVFDGFTLKIEVFNAAAESIFGCNQNETVGRLITDFLPSDVIELQLASFDRLHEKQDEEAAAEEERNSSDDSDEEKKGKRKHSVSIELQENSGKNKGNEKKDGDKDTKKDTKKKRKRKRDRILIQVQSNLCKENCKNLSKESFYSSFRKIRFSEHCQYRKH